MILPWWSEETRPRHGGWGSEGTGLSLGCRRVPGLGAGLEASLAPSDSASCSDTVEEDEDLYDCVENEEAEGDEVYEDLMRSEPVPMPVCGGAGPGWAGSWVGRIPGHPNISLSSPLSAQDDRV